ncbi:MAG: glycosyltransferase family 4 protein, partial [Chloroflexota bacterium]
MTATWQELPALALVGTYPPRRCGIATFTRDLRDALVDLTPPGARTPLVVAVDRGRRDPPRYPPEVTFRLKRSDPEAYVAAAAQLAVAGTEVVSLQHEYGIFGGPSGRHVLGLAAALRVPLVTTLHTVRAHPTPLQRAILVELVRQSARVVVMSERARHLLSSDYEAPSDKLQVIPHGVPQIAMVDPAEARARLGLPGGPLILSFGLLGPAKRLELVIDALAIIRDRVPQTLFAIVGATHPEVRLRDGERYRAALATRAQALGLEPHLLFVDRYVDDDELVAWLQAADLFVTPYGNAEQAASGTLAYAVAAGRACISTPYDYARELLADGRGVLVPFDDIEALADRLLALLTDPVERREIGNRARALAANMSWDAVGDGYRAIFSQVAGEARHTLRPVQMITPEAAGSDGRVARKTLPPRVLPR